MTLFLLIIAALIIYYFFIYKEGGFENFEANRGKKCANCHNPIEESYNVCPICKETLKRKCSNCGEKLDATWRFCPYCEKLIGGSEKE